SRLHPRGRYRQERDQMKGEIILSDGLIVTPEEVVRGTVTVKKGMIDAIDHGRSSLLDRIDLEGDYLLPGLIELHTDHLERHFVPRPGVRWPPLAAILSHDAAVASAGITTVFDALAIGEILENSARVRDLQNMVQAIQTAQDKRMLRSEHLIHLRCEVGYPRVMELLDGLIDHSLVKFVSLMDHTPGQRQFTRIEKFVQYYQGKYGFSNEQMERLIIERQENQKRYAPRYRKEIIGICKQLHLPVASHDDTTVDHVMEAATDGIVLSEFPTTLEAAEAARSYGLSILMGAPNLVLGGSHSGNASALELGKRGLLDILSSDYVPSSLIQGAFLLHQGLDIPLPEAIATVTVTPARISNLDDRGALQVGKRADLIRVKWDPPMPIVRNVWRDGQQIF
ncbi:MAG: alpha-D-ribose 1-methylphosphonate 5-triphosphate diphosphatase, partial [Thermodesulfobacteriota bacterium]